MIKNKKIFENGQNSNLNALIKSQSYNNGQMLHQEITNSSRNINSIWLVAVIVACLIGMTSCANMRSVRSNDIAYSKSNKSMKKPKSVKNIKTMNEDEVNAALADEEKQAPKKVIVENNDANESTNIAAYNDNSDEQQAIPHKERKIPTLREQMKSLGDDQASIKKTVNNLQDDVGELKSSLVDIKNSIRTINLPKPEQKAVAGENNANEFISSDEVISSHANSEDRDVQNSNNTKDIKLDYSDTETFISPDEDKQVKGNDAKDNTKTSEKTSSVKKHANSKKSTTALNTNKKAGHNSAKYTNKAITKKNNTKKKLLNRHNKKENYNKTQEETAPKTINVENNAVPEPQSKPNSNTGSLKSALQYFSQKDYNSAAMQLGNIKKSTKDQSTIANCDYWLGESSFGLKNYDLAINYFSKVAGAKNAAKRAEAQMMIAECYLRNGKIQAAKKSFENFIAQNPKSRLVPRARKMLQQL